MTTELPAAQNDGGKMNRFVHRILKSSTAASIGGSRLHGRIMGGGNTDFAAAVPQHLVEQEIGNAKLIYFGEIHSEQRITTFLAEMVRHWSEYLTTTTQNSSSSVSSSPAPRLHLIMEHFSVDMQPLLDKYANGETDEEDDDDKAFDELKRSYREDYGTEGHDLEPYRDLITFCRNTTKSKNSVDDGSNSSGGCTIHIHGGFIPRNHAGRLNKECPTLDLKRQFFNEISTTREYLPNEDNVMYEALFEDKMSFRLRGTKEHRMLIKSMMRGIEIYTPVEDEEADEEDEMDDPESSLARLYQAQLLKDHAMGYQIAKLLLEHSSVNDRFLVIAGSGHLKHRCGVPECVVGYLRHCALFDSDVSQRTVALDVLMSISRQPMPGQYVATTTNKFNGIGSSTIMCQMLYEAYLEDTFPHMIEALAAVSDDDEDAKTNIKRATLKHHYLGNPELMDEYVLKSDEIRGPFLHYANGIVGFDHPCADYLFVYDEDDDNVITEADYSSVAKMMSSSSEGRPKCPFPHDGNTSIKDETAEAYERVGKTAALTGNVTRAKAIMKQIGYTPDDMDYIGDDDIYNYQGVANPHTVAKIQPGESVLDVGSGLGIDSFLAMRDCGADKFTSPASTSSDDNDVVMLPPFVVGVDLAGSEVMHASKRASERGYDVPRRIQFIRGDVEKLEDAFLSKNLSLGTFDVCISNGAFCLVPDKMKGFRSVFKALKPGGRMAISTTTIVSDKLDPSFEWPVCMRMFAPLECIVPMCEEIGFTNVVVVDAESPMETEIPLDQIGTNNEQRTKIHGVYTDQYDFLQRMDMDELCKVVTIYGEKPC
jgi:SAM-dependent methyltransferase